MEETTDSGDVVDNIQPALVSMRIHEHRPVPARFNGAVLYSDQIYWRHRGPRRYFWLVEEDIQMIYEPFGWRDEWYVDVVSFECWEHDGSLLFTVHDRYLDFVVEGMGPTYRVLDLDEAGQALLDGAFAAADLARALSAAQRFVDSHLHRGAVFPPSPTKELFSPDHRYPGWADEDAGFSR
jgi:predicted RNA-binding protein associated with RNAse of E/G family